LKYFIIIDGGTQNIKAFVFDTKGNVVSKSVCPVSPYFSNAPNFAEQDAENYLSIVKEVTGKAVKGSHVSDDDFVAVAITTHRSTIIPVDKEGKAVRPAITWLDERKTEGLRLPRGASRMVVKLVGKEYLMKEYQRRSKFNWLMKNEPENYKKTYKFLTTSSHIFTALTGEFKDSSSMIVGIFPIDLKHLKWYDFPFVYKALGVTREKLPDLVNPTDIAGYVSEKGAKAFGIKKGLPVVIGAGDKQSELLAGGGINSDIAEISYGTAAVIDILSDSFITHPHMDFFTWGSAIPKKWVLEGLVGGGYWMVSWFEKEFARHELIEAKKRGISPEVLLDKEMADIAPGSDGLVLQPYWFPFAFDPSSRGAIVGFSAKHTRVHVYRAIVEGIAYELKRVLEVIRQYSGQYPKELVIGGGGSESAEIMQITSDIFNLPAKRMHTPYLSALGAAIDASVAIGIYKDFETATKNMSRVKDVFYPQPENVKIYDRLFNEVYKNIYPSLKNLYHRMNKILKQ
jgi:sugar (pentulose or hexulose) kinase